MEFTLGKTKVKTKVKDGAGKTPVWNETLVIETQQPDILEISCMEKDMMSSDLIGNHFLSLHNYLCKPGQMQDVKLELIYESEIAGQVSFKLQWDPAPGFVLDAGKKDQFFQKVIF